MHKMGTDGWLAKAICFFAGNQLGGALQDTGIAPMLYNTAKANPSPIAQAFARAADAGYQEGGLKTGQWLNKSAGIALTLHSLYKQRNSGHTKITNELAFGLGALTDPPDSGYTSGYAGSGGTQGYWSS